jgi:hypothetical protein
MSAFERIDAFKAEIAQIQCLNKHIDRANRIVFVDPILKAFSQQRRLPAIQPRHEARHQIPRRTSCVRQIPIKIAH